jgi:glycosyltransferase involved in cell wall biosynthesis
MRIAYLNPCGKLGGAETSLRELLASVRAAEPSWELQLVLGEDGPLADIGRDLGCNVIVLPFPPALARIGDTAGGRVAILLRLLRVAPGTLAYSRDLAACLREIKPDIIHTNGLKMHLLAAWIRPRGTPLVWHIHDYVGKRRLMSKLLKRSQKACTIAVANSESVASDLKALLPGLKVTPIHNAVNLRRFSPAGKSVDLDALSGLPTALPATVRVGLVGTFARWKGHEVFIQALARLAADMPVRGYIIGGPIYQTDGSQWSQLELKQEAERCGLSGKLGFTGFLEDTAAAMRSLDIIVHASTSPEPFGMVIIEAMACGKAVIASQAGGATELFVDGENAVAHPPGDAAILAKHISRLASDPDLRARLGAAGRATAQRLWNGQRLAKELLAVYARAAAPSGPAALQRTSDAPELARTSATMSRR